MNTITLTTDEFEGLVHAAEERERLDKLINNPQTDEFIGAVRSEMAHQVERWGHAHDRDKSAQAWFWLVGYLSGKALRAAICGDRGKALHHCVSSAAALGNWFKAVQADTTGCGDGSDADLAQLDRRVMPRLPAEPREDDQGLTGGREGVSAGSQGVGRG